MALPSTLVWEARETGDDLNGGGFDAASKGVGTDYSEQDAPVAAFSDLAVDSTDATKVSSASVGFTPALTGNLLRLASSQVFAVKSVDGTGVATLDRAAGTAGETGLAGRIGGCNRNLNRLAADMVAHNLAFVKAGAYSEVGTVTFNQNADVPSPSNPPTRIIGYSSVRSDYRTPDLSRPVVTVAGTANGLVFGGDGWFVANLEVVGNGLNSVVVSSGAHCVFYRCKASGFTSTGIAATNLKGSVLECEVTNDRQSTDGLSGGLVMGCYVHDLDSLFSTVIAPLALRNIIANNAGAGPGLRVDFGTTNQCLFNTIDNIGGDGIQLHDSTVTDVSIIKGNIFSRCGGYGISLFNPGCVEGVQVSGNAFSRNTGNFWNLDPSAGVNPVNAYLGANDSSDVMISASPFVDEAGGDYRLNALPDAGALLRGTAPFGGWPGSGVVGGLDFGAVQSVADAAPPPVYRQFWIEG